MVIRTLQYFCTRNDTISCLDISVYRFFGLLTRFKPTVLDQFENLKKFYFIDMKADDKIVEIENEAYKLPLTSQYNEVFADEMALFLENNEAGKGEMALIDKTQRQKLIARFRSYPKLYWGSSDTRVASVL